MKTGTRARRNGFTLLEVLLATFIMVFAIASTAALLMATSTQGTVSRRATEAAALAQKELEVLRDMRFDDIASAAPTTLVVGSNSYTLERVVTANDPAPNMKRIRVTLTWVIRGTQTYVAETIFTNLSQ
ncbi:MAG: type IV pilus modification PilV family protein [Armatimonadota bacterium]